MRPLILLSSGRRAGEHSTLRAVSALYGEAVTRAGGTPAAYAGGEPARLAARFDGLLLTGGGDVAPERYGAVRLPSDEVDEARDAEELALIEAFLARRRPIFGICRGIQLLNVAFGGTLYQQVENHAGNARHDVRAAAGSRVEALCGGSFAVNSWHHQAVREAAQGLRVTARSDDGVIEAVEHEILPVLAVQWHPERMIEGVCMDVPNDQLCLFTDFIKECERQYESDKDCQFGRGEARGQ